MSPVIRPAVVADIEPICALLHGKMNANVPLERWRRLMTYPWMTDKPDLGRVVEDNGSILGFVGMVYSDRLVEGTIERFVSISSWYLDRAVRGRGLGAGLMAAATADPAITYTNFSSSDRVLEIVDAVGYRVLDEHRHVWRKKSPPDPALLCEWEAGAIRRRASQAERLLLDDHAGMPVRPALVEAGGLRALLFFSVKLKGADVTFFDILHAGDGVLLARHGQALANAILPDGPAVLAADSRFLPGAPDVAPEGAEREALAVPRFYISTRLAPGQIDLLYSELQLLDLKLY